MQPSPIGRRVGIRIVTFEACSGYRGRDGHCWPPTGSREAVARLPFPQNVACGFTVVTGIGGGMVRDVLLAEIPTVLRAELYAVAALAAAAIVVIGQLLQLPIAPVTALALISCFLLRVLAIKRGWRLPVAKNKRRESSTE